MTIAPSIPTEASATLIQATQPPNLHFTTVQSITAIGTCFLRVRVQGDDLTSFRNEAIHFRLLFPPVDCIDPEWPRLSESSTTLWPKGDKALHRPSYTTRWIDCDAGLMDFDVFLHDGGRVTEWVRHAAPGDPVVIAGPGGGGIPETSKILIFADETAFPAVARILENLPSDSTGQVTLVAERGAECGYPMSAPCGVELNWLSRHEAQDLSKRALQAHMEHPDHFFWFASKKSDVKPVREIVKASNPRPGTSYIAAYWRQP